MELLISIPFGAIAYFMFRKQICLELRSLKRNDLAPHGRTLLLRKSSMVAFGTLVYCELLFQILLPPNPSGNVRGSSPSLGELIATTGLGPFTLASLIALELWIAAIFRSASSRGIFDELRLTHATRQDVLLGVFWPVAIAAAVSWNLHGVFSLVVEGRGDAFLKLPGVALRQSAIAFFLVSYFFCALIHGLGFLRVWGLLLYSIFVTQVILTPFYVNAFLMPTLGGSLLRIVQAVIYAIAGTMFYRSFRQYNEDPELRILVPNRG